MSRLLHLPAVRLSIGGIAGALLAASLSTGPALAASVGLGETYNALIFGGFSASSGTVEGRLAVGGTATLNNYSVGDKLTGAMIGGDTLVVGGDLKFPSGRVYNGDIVVQGSTKGLGKSVTNGLTPYALEKTSALPVAFTAEEARFQKLSLDLAALTVTGTDLYKWSQLFLTGDGQSALQVFNITAEDLSKATNIVVDGIAAGATVLINVAGETASMSGGMDAFFASNRDHILFNFYEAETLTLANIGLQGSVLAPDASIDARSGTLWGQVVGESWSGSMTLANVTFAGTLPAGDAAAVDAPASLALFATALVLLAVLARRFGRRPAIARRPDRR